MLTTISRPHIDLLNWQMKSFIHTHESIKCVSYDIFNLGYIIQKITFGSCTCTSKGPKCFIFGNVIVVLYLVSLVHAQLLIVAHQFLEVMCTIIGIDSHNTLCRMGRKFLNYLILGRHFNT